jgi:Ca2+-binding EF-hand superfamily protein
MIKTTQILKLLAPLALLLPTQAQDCEQGSCGNQERAQRTSIQDPADRPSDRAGIRKRLLKKYDANKDGKLDRKELAQARKDGALPGRGERGGDGQKPKDGKGQKPKDGKGKKPKDGKGQEPKDGADRRARFLKKYDTNKDGKLDRKELAQARKDGALPGRGESGQGPTPQDQRGQRARLLKKYDANKDGKLDKKELAQAKKDGALPGRGEGGEDPTPREQRGRRARLLKKYDANKDGKLDKKELAQAKKDGALPGRGEGGEGNKKPKDGEGETPKKRKGKRGKIG